MNAPTLDDAPIIQASRTPEWRRLVLPLTLGLLLLGVLFRAEVVAAVQTWDASTAYNHCFLIIPIALYLLWDRRFDLIGVNARPMPLAILLGIPLALVWLFAERLGIMEGRQLVALSFAEVLFLAILGKRLWWAVSGPLLYLYFLVPFGDFLTPQLQDVTTWFIRQGLDLAGVPAYIDGYIIEIPQGTFFVAEACAGLRFLVASVAFGTLYALMIYRGPVRRGLFILVSIIVPIVANGFRGFGIVYLGYLLGSAQAAAADHIIYGWIFFSIVILILIALGLPFRQDEMSTRSTTPPDAPTPYAMRRVLAVALAMTVVAAIGPTVAAGLTMATTATAQVPDFIDPGPGCVVQATPPTEPAPPNMKSQRVRCGDLAMDMHWAAFSPRITAAPLMAERWKLTSRAHTEGLQEHWFAPADHTKSAWRIMLSNDPEFVTAVAMWVDGKPTRPGLAMRARMAIDSLFGSAYAPMVVTVTPAVNWNEMKGRGINDAEASLKAFLRHHTAMDQTIGTLSGH